MTGRYPPDDLGEGAADVSIGSMSDPGLEVCFTLKPVIGYRGRWAKFQSGL